MNQKIDIKLWFLHEWEDKRLVWDPAEYGKIQFLHIPADKLWLPDMAIYNNADGDFIISELVRAKVYFNGSVRDMNQKLDKLCKKLCKKFCEKF